MKKSKLSALQSSGLGLPSLPAIAGYAALAAAAVGSLTMTQKPVDLAQLSSSNTMAAGSQINGASDAELLSREAAISRDASRDQMITPAGAEQVAAAQAKARQRLAEWQAMAGQAEKTAAQIEANQWVLPVNGYHLTATFGMSSGLWSRTHTGLDFAAPYGSTLYALANGVVTETGYDGAYGNKTVLTLDDGTEIWYCHQSAINVSVGDVVHGGQAIGALGNTGNTTGPHLHLEVRPTPDTPIDPYSALVEHNLAP